MVYREVSEREETGMAGRPGQPCRCNVFFLPAFSFACLLGRACVLYRERERDRSWESSSSSQNFPKMSLGRLGGARAHVPKQLMRVLRIS